MHSEEVIKLLRRIRHDFGNHLQVISGYNELRRPEDVSSYLKTVIMQMDSERQILALADADIALYLYETMLSAQDMGIILRYKNIFLNSLACLQEQQEPLDSLVAMMTDRGAMKDEPQVYVTLQEEPEIIKMVFEWEPNNDQMVKVIRK